MSPLLCVNNVKVGRAAGKVNVPRFSRNLSDSLAAPYAPLSASVYKNEQNEYCMKKPHAET